jgi:ankyrin repeat protein
MGVSSVIINNMGGSSVICRKDKHSRTPLSWASEMAEEAVIKHLLKYSANIDYKNKYSRTLLL